MWILYSEDGCWCCWCQCCCCAINMIVCQSLVLSTEAYYIFTESTIWLYHHNLHNKNRRYNIRFLIYWGERERERAESLIISWFYWFFVLVLSMFFSSFLPRIHVNPIESLLVVVIQLANSVIKSNVCLFRFFILVPLHYHK